MAYIVGSPVVVTTGYQPVIDPSGQIDIHGDKNIKDKSGATIQDLFDYDDEGYPISTYIGRLLDGFMKKQGLVRTDISEDPSSPQWQYTLPEITIKGKRRKGKGNK